MQFIHLHRSEHPVHRLCRAVELPRSAYYRWAARRSQEADDEVAPDATITQLIIQRFYFHKRRYGTRRMVAELADLGYPVGRDRVRAVYRQFDLRAIQPRSFVPRTTQPHPNRRRSPNLLLDSPLPRGMDRLWVGDITYLPLLEPGKFCYLATLQDSYSRTIVGYAVADHMREELTLSALNQALDRRRPAAGLIVHTDGGGQYASVAYRDRLARSGYRSSMTRRDNHYDNAQAESFFSRLKAELLEGGRRRLRDLAEARRECFAYIEGYYNTVRRHSALGYLSPLNFERTLSGNGS